MFTLNVFVVKAVTKEGKATETPFQSKTKAEDEMATLQRYGIECSVKQYKMEVQQVPGTELVEVQPRKKSSSDASEAD
ncbi:UNVERIFIED_CONTAM: hypothetical protein RF648_20010, partial [Kocuria sp. CPCC 205274]